MLDTNKESNFIAESGIEESKQEESFEETLDTAMSQFSLEESSSSLVPDIIKASNRDDLQAQIEKFNLTQSKKNALRIMKLNSLLDQVEDQAIKRFTEKPDMVSNKDLLDYMQVVAGQIERSQKYLDQLEEKPAIRINNQKNEVNLNIQSDALSSDSKEKVIAAVKALLKQVNEENTNTVEVEPKDCIVGSDVVEASSVIVDEKIDTTKGEMND